MTGLTPLARDIGQMPIPGQSTPRAGLPYALAHVAAEAACAAFHWIGRGHKERGDAAAVDAMRRELNRLDIDGVVVIGEGEKDAAPQLYRGERVGRRESGFRADVAVDPVEGTSYLANGLTNAMAVVALAPRGAMFDPGPAFYMEKIVTSAAVIDLDPTAAVGERLRVIARGLGREISELTIYVLEKPRHRQLVAQIHGAGAKVALYPAGDVAGAVLASMPDSGIDALMGTGGTPEGILAACAVAALRGRFWGRIDPQLELERRAVNECGIDTTRWLSLNELVGSDDLFFAATGITSGLLVDGVERTANGYRTQTLLTASRGPERHVLTSWLPFSDHNFAEVTPCPELTQ